jgi:2-polyprenyl-3-methyl-5-hydroxy-6-metoxy-1,4-benzoquinol methylase
VRYTGKAPWDTGKVQPAFQKAAEKRLAPSLKPVCGRGDNASFLAGRGHAVTGFDFLEEPIAKAQRKASD